MKQSTWITLGWMVLTSGLVFANPEEGLTGIPKINNAKTSNLEIRGDEVLDKNTNLIWARCSVGQHWEGGMCKGTVNTFTFDQALKQADEKWRLPTRDELESLLDPSQLKINMKMMIDVSAFPDMDDRHLIYRTSENILGAGWVVFFDDGNVTTHRNNMLFAVRLVRPDAKRKQAEDAEAERQKRAAATTPKGFVAQGGLTWTNINSSGMKWSDANSYCNNTLFNGQSGWRLPLKDELIGLYHSGAMKDQMKDQWSAIRYFIWSSTPGSAGGHYIFNLGLGSVAGNIDKDNFYVTCVR